MNAAQLSSMLKKAELPHSGPKGVQVARISENGGIGAPRPTKQQITYVSAVMRRQQIVPPLAAVRDKDQCRLWLTEHGAWPGR